MIPPNSLARLLFILYALCYVNAAFAQKNKAVTKTTWLINSAERKIRKESIIKYNDQGDEIEETLFLNNKREFSSVSKQHYKDGLKVKTVYKQGSTIFHYDSLRRLIKTDDFRDDMDTIFTTEINTYLADSKNIAFTDCYEFREKTPSNRYTYEYYDNNLLKKTTLADNSSIYSIIVYHYGPGNLLAYSVETSHHSTPCGEKWVTDTIRTYYSYNNGRLRKERVKVNNRRSIYYLYEYR